MMMVEFIKNLQLFTSLNSGIDMKPKEFFDAVVRMREKQQEYFKTKTSSALTESKRLERALFKRDDNGVLTGITLSYEDRTTSDTQETRKEKQV